MVHLVILNLEDNTKPYTIVDVVEQETVYNINAQLRTLFLRPVRLSVIRLPNMEILAEDTTIGQILYQVTQSDIYPVWACLVPQEEPVAASSSSQASSSNQVKTSETIDLPPPVTSYTGLIIPIDAKSEDMDRLLQLLEQGSITGKFSSANQLAISRVLRAWQKPQEIKRLTNDEEYRASTIHHLLSRLGYSDPGEILGQLPAEILLNIAQQMDIENLIALGATNRYYRQLILQPEVMRAQVEKYNYNIVGDLSNEEQWRKFLQYYDKNYYSERCHRRHTEKHCLILALATGDENTKDAVYSQLDKTFNNKLIVEKAYIHSLEYGSDSDITYWETKHPTFTSLSGFAVNGITPILAATAGSGNIERFQRISKQLTDNTYRLDDEMLARALSHGHIKMFEYLVAQHRGSPIKIKDTYTNAVANGLEDYIMQYVVQGKLRFSFGEPYTSYLELISNSRMMDKFLQTVNWSDTWYQYSNYDNDFTNTSTERYPDSPRDEDYDSNEEDEDYDDGEMSHHAIESIINKWYSSVFSKASLENIVRFLDAHKQFLDQQPADEGKYAPQANLPDRVTRYTARNMRAVTSRTDGQELEIYKYLLQRFGLDNIMSVRQRYFGSSDYYEYDSIPDAFMFEPMIINGQRDMIQYSLDSGILKYPEVGQELYNAATQLGNVEYMKYLEQLTQLDKSGAMYYAMLNNNLPAIMHLQPNGIKQHWKTYFRSVKFGSDLYRDMQFLNFLVYSPGIVASEVVKYMLAENTGYVGGVDPRYLCQLVDYLLSKKVITTYFLLDAKLRYTDKFTQLLDCLQQKYKFDADVAFRMTFIKDDPMVIYWSRYTPNLVHHLKSYFPQVINEHREIIKRIIVESNLSDEQLEDLRTNESLKTLVDQALLRKEQNKQIANIRPLWEW